MWWRIAFSTLLIPSAIAACVMLVFYVDKWIDEVHKKFVRHHGPVPADARSETVRPRVHSGKPAAKGPALAGKATVNHADAAVEPASRP
jgi:hypothetical protein